MEISKYGQITFKEEADRMFPDGCTEGNNAGGDCDYCQIYYGWHCPKCGSPSVGKASDESWPSCEDCGFAQYDAETLALQAEVKREQAQAKRELGYIPTYKEWVNR